MQLREHRVIRRWVLGFRGWVGVLFAPVALLLASVRLWPVEQALIGPDGARHALAVPDAAFASNFDFKNPFPRRVINGDGDVPMQQVLRSYLVWAQPGVAQALVANPDAIEAALATYENRLYPPKRRNRPRDRAEPQAVF